MSVAAHVASRLEVVIPIEPAGQCGEVDDIGLVAIALDFEEMEAPLPDVLHVLAQDPRHRHDQITVIVMLPKGHLRTLPR